MEKNYITDKYVLALKFCRKIKKKNPLVQPKVLYFIRLPREPKVILSSKSDLQGKAFRCVATSGQCQDRAQETGGVHAYFVWMKFLTVVPALQVSRVTICISRALALWGALLSFVMSSLGFVVTQQSQN